MTVLRWLNDLSALLFPRLCNACGESLYKGEKHICTGCYADLPYTDFHLHPDNRLARQFWGRLPVDAAMSLFYFRKGGKIQHLIHNLKYGGQKEVGLLLGNLVGQRLLQSPRFNGIGAIIPVPLHPKKERIRGYNQAALIAQGIGRVLNLQVYEHTLIRKKITESQTRKSKFIRYENIQSAFSLHAAKALEHQHVLLVDDVMTTGATLESCGQTLLEGKIEKLSIATVAFTC